jgi:imidazolonepropionase
LSARRAGRPRARLVVENASEVLTMERPGLAGPRRRADLREIGRVENGAVAVQGEKIVWVGPAASLARDVDVAEDATRIDAAGGVVCPGFVDCHTHLVFAGSRHEEFERRLAGESYLEIASKGGGIRASVRAVREASEAELAALARARLDLVLAHGTTTLEAKSGYGLATEHELKQIRALAAASVGHSVETVGTFLGAHEFPPEYANDRAGYVRLLLDEMIPAVAATRLCEYADVFCEKGVFTVERARRVLTAAREAGMKPRLHADEFAASGAAELAAELGAASADHLSAVSNEGIAALAASETIGVLLPGTTFSCRIPPADARKLIDAGVAVAIATDMNPGSCGVESMGVVIGLACLHLGMLPSEAFAAATINAAYALERAERIGSIAPGKQADLLILDVADHRALPQRFGTNHVRVVVKKGRVVVGG